MKKIATSVFEFEDLIRKNMLYVDKTSYVWELVSSGEKCFFLSRPRRFGKSLLLSTFKAFFQGKKELFKGLDIERLAPEEWETYPIIHLDLAIGSSCESKDAIAEKLKTQVRDAAILLGVDVKQNTPSQMFHDLIFFTYQKYQKQLVILIDEYDKPILDSIHKPYMNEVLEMMATFYQEIKSANDKERFVFITGVTKFAHVSLFSGSNNPMDLTRRVGYATILGYTEEELRENFSEYIDEVAHNFNVSREELLEEVKLNYDGFRFVSQCESVYNPVSVGNFFIKGKFDNYWISTGTPRFLLNMVKDNPFAMNDITKEWVPDVENNKYDLSCLDLRTVAFQAGYLAIVEWRKLSKFTWAVRYDFPNKEIRDCWYQNILTLKPNTEGLLMPLLVSLPDDLNDQNVDAFMEKVCNFFSGIPYENAGEITEGYFRNHLRTLFCLFGIPNQCEIMEASQRVDIVAQTAKMALVFELKMMNKDEADPETKQQQLLAEAIEQGRTKGYEEKYKNESEIVHTIGIVFDEKSRKVACWAVME